MKIFRIGVAALFCITLLIFCLYLFITSGNVDNTIPQIVIEGDIIDVSLQADDAELLQGVTAFDEKDGNLTDRVFIESVSEFIAENTCNVTYSVCDSDNNVSSATRKIRYPDYVSPQFFLKNSLVINSFSPVELSNLIGASDVIDGDISDDVIISTTNYKASTPGNYTMALQVKNSHGETIVLRLPVIVEEISLRAPIIKLSQYLVYLKKGSDFDPQSYVDGVYLSNGSAVDLKCVIETNISTDTPGVYPVHYFATDSAGNRAHTMLAVVVE